LRWYWLPRLRPQLAPQGHKGLIEALQLLPPQRVLLPQPIGFAL
jgi:hypothetical protein